MYTFIEDSNDCVRINACDRVDPSTNPNYICDTIINNSTCVVVKNDADEDVGKCQCALGMDAYSFDSSSETYTKLGMVTFFRLFSRT